MSIDRKELESLDRDALILRAERAGIARARILTRPEIVDEILLRAMVPASTRGFFGRARDLLSRVIEKGLHLPEAAELLRTSSGISGESAAIGRGRGVVPTLTLAEIYVGQGHASRAIDILERVLSAEPDHTEAQSRLEELKREHDGSESVSGNAIESEEEASEKPETETDEAPAGEPAPETATRTHDEPLAISTAEALAEIVAPVSSTPSIARSDAAVLAIVDSNGRIAVAWELSEALASWGQTLEPEARLVLRVVDVRVSSGEILEACEEVTEVTLKGTRLLSRPLACVTRVSLGLSREDNYRSLAHSPFWILGPDGRPRALEPESSDVAPVLLHEGLASQCLQLLHSEER